MNYIGRKIYYEKITGNIILITSEMCGSVLETTIEQDFQSYEVLKNRVKETIGVIQLQYGELSSEFGRCSGCRVDVTKEVIDSMAIIFDYTPQVEEEIQREKTLEEKVAILEKENAELKITLAETVEKQEKDKTELQLTIAQMIEGSVVNG